MRGHGRAALVAVLGAAACLTLLGVVLLPPQRARAAALLLPAEEASAEDPAVLTFGAAHWDSTRLPQDRRNPADEIRMRGSPLSEVVLASRVSGIHLPGDRASRAARHVGEKINNVVRALDLVAGTSAAGPRQTGHWMQPAPGNTALRAVSRTMAGQIADNSAAALRQQSFRWAMDDCKKDGSCQSLLGKELYNVLQTKPGEPNLRIYHDQDDDRKDEERQIERDYRSAHDTEAEGESQSKSRWQKLQGLMHTRSFRADAPSARSVLRQVDEINAERIPATEKRILISTLVRKSSVARRAASLNDAYRSETSLIFPSSQEHWNTYKASMMPSGDDKREEMGEDLRQHARPSEADMMRKYQNKAVKEITGRSSSSANDGQQVQVNVLGNSREKRTISRSAQRQVAEWTKQASVIRHQLADGSVSALRTKRVDGEKTRDVVTAASTQDYIHDELSRYGSVFSSRGDEEKLRKEEHGRREALEESRRRERRLQRARTRQHNKIVAEEVKEAKSADSELASYDDAFVPHAQSSKGPSMSALGLASRSSGGSGREGGPRGRDYARTQARRSRHPHPLDAALDFQTPQEKQRAPDTAALEERHDVRTAEDIAPMVQLAENTLKSIGRMRHNGDRHEGAEGAERRAGGKCYLAGGKEVPCTELAELGDLMKKVYGKEARDVEIESRDHSFDPTKVFADSKEAASAEARWMRIEDRKDNGERKDAAKRRVGERSAEERPPRKLARRHASTVGELLHEANVKAAQEHSMPKPVKKGSLAALSDNLGSVLGW